jgi:histidinol-phosphatase
MGTDLELAFLMVDAADAETSQAWRSTGVASTAKPDGSPVTAADVAAETAMLTVLRQRRPGDGFLGEELGDRAGTTSRRWIADGIDGTRDFATGAETWGTLLALEVDGEIRVGVCSSPLQQRRWWAVRGGGAFTGRTCSTTRSSRPSGRREPLLVVRRSVKRGGIRSTDRPTQPHLAIRAAPRRQTTIR